MKKIHIIGPQGQKNINDLVIYLILPCNILHAFTQSAADGDFTNYLEILLIVINVSSTVRSVPMQGFSVIRSLRESMEWKVLYLPASI